MEGLGGAQRILENQFMQSFHTGNFIVDTLIKGLIITATTAVFFYLKTIVSNWHQYVDKVLSFVGMKMNKIIINWKVMKTEDSELKDTSKINSSKRFEAILHQVMKLQYEEAGVCTFLENPNPESVSFMVAQNAPFTFSPGVFGTIRTDTTEGQVQAYGREILIPETFVAEIYSRTKTLKDLQNMLENWVEEYEKFEKETGENQVQFFGRLTREGQFNFSERLFAILHQLEKKGTANQDIKVLKEFAIEESKNYWRPEDKDLRRAEKLIPEVIEIEKDVFCKVSCASWYSKDGKVQADVEVVVKIYSKLLKVPELVAMTKLWEEEYEEHNQFEKGLIYFVFNPPPKDRDSFYDRGPKSYYTEFPFESGKTFKNIFFPEKEKLMEKIQFFRDNESWYMKRGIPHMLGLLLHGEPGCGKTSVIKAIANMTQRHIISVPLKNVNTTADLYHALYGGKIDKRTIPMNKRLYVLEDIDCGGLADVVNKRTEKKKQHERKRYDSDSSSEKDKEKRDKEKEKKELTLSDLLEAFDGVLEMKGRMMVITTNHLDKLDPALIRPGRIDTSLEFKRCTREIIIEILENFFDNETIPDDFDASKIKDVVWTPAEVVQICINHRTNLRMALEKIVERKIIPKNKTETETEEYGFYS